MTSMATTMMNGFSRCRGGLHHHHHHQSHTCQGLRLLLHRRHHRSPAHGSCKKSSGGGGGFLVVLRIRSEAAEGGGGGGSEEPWLQLLGGRGLPGGEAYLKDEAKRKVLIETLVEVAEGSSSSDSSSSAADSPTSAATATGSATSTIATATGSATATIATATGSAADSVQGSLWEGSEGFDKEMMGLTGGFPGGETGLRRFIQENPPPPPSSRSDSSRPSSSSSSSSLAMAEKMLEKKNQKIPAPPLPLLMPGMTVVVKNKSSPFHMYGGIVQRVSDGRAGVLLEGGNWDKLLTFYLEELERTSSGPPMSNPKSAVLLLQDQPAE